jgi:multidrug efflux pump
LAVGAGAEMRKTLGLAVFSGMLGVTIFGIFLTPVFFYVIQGFGENKLFSRPSVQWLGVALVVLVNILLLGIPALFVYVINPAIRGRKSGTG